MRLLNTLRDERGFTIQEILVVLVVGFLVVGFGLSLFQFTGKLMGNWSRRSESRTLVNSICQQIAFDIQRSRGVREVTDTSLVLKYDLGRYVVFRFGDKHVWRNDISMGEFPDDMLAVRLTIDSVGVVYQDITAGDFSAGLRVSSPWCSRWHFEHPLVGRNATRN